MFPRAPLWLCTSLESTSISWILCEVKVDRELLDRAKLMKSKLYGLVTRNYESLEKGMVQECVRTGLKLGLEIGLTTITRVRNKDVNKKC